MKYFTYLSDSKLDMLFGQISGSRDRSREVTLGFDVKVAKGEIKSGQRATETKYQKLEAVLTELRNTDQVGNIGEGKPYIEGRLRLHVGALMDRYEHPDTHIALWGYSRDAFTMVLTGSSRHLLGHDQPDPQSPPSSGMGDLLMWMSGRVKHDPQEYESQMFRPYDLNDRLQMELRVLRKIVLSGTVTNDFEFVAKTLYRTKSPEPGADDFLVASPLYVAQVD